MKRWLEAANDYIGSMKVCDMALLKICVCAAGVLWGMTIPKRNRKSAAFITMGVFSVTFVLLLMPFLDRLSPKES